MVFYRVVGARLDCYILTKLHILNVKLAILVRRGQFFLALVKNEVLTNALWQLNANSIVKKPGARDDGRKLKFFAVPYAKCF